MNNEKFIIRDKVIASNAINAIRSLFNEGDILDKPVIVEIKEHKGARSLAQNNLSHKWYTERAGHIGTTHGYEHCYCKLEYGCPILIVDSNEFAEFYLAAIEPLEYEKKIEAMKYISITSIMNVTQMKQYLNDIDYESGRNGICLSHPEDLYLVAMGR